MVEIGVFFEWEKGKYYTKKINFDVVEASGQQQCKLCWFNINNFHCPKLPCGKYARPDGKAIYFREVK